MFESLEDRRLLAAGPQVLTQQSMEYDIPASSSLAVFANLNDDELLDLISAGSGGASVQLAIDATSFAAPIAFDTLATKQIVAADLTGDGMDALLFVGNGSTKVAGLSVDGSIQQSFVLATTGDNVEVADVDQDGHLDVVSGSGAAIQVWRGIGDGTFSVPIRFAISGSVDRYQVFVQDLNQDTYPDILAAGNSRAVSLLNDGEGIFESTWEKKFTTDFHVRAVADVDNDGLPDVIGSSSSKVLGWKGVANGSFGLDLQTSVAPGAVVQIEAGDVNDDGLVDLVVSHDREFHTGFVQGVSLFEGVAAGGFGRSLQVTPLLPQTFSLNNVDADGRLAVVVVEENRVRSWTTRESPVFEERLEEIEVMRQPIQVAVDVNGDGLNESVSATDEGLELRDRILFGALLQSVPLGFAAGQLLRGDVNGDGRDDVVAIEQTANEKRIATLFAGADGKLLPPIVTAIAKFEISSGHLLDLNGDGIPDIVGTNRQSFQIHQGNADGSFREAQIVPVENFVSGDRLQFVDLNGDDIPEIIEDSFRLTIATRQPDGKYVVQSRDGTGSRARFGDFNGDGNMDLATARQEVSVQFGIGDGNFQSPVTIGVGNRVLATDDLDEDGIDELIVANRDLVTVLAWQSDDQFASQLEYVGASNAGSVIVADFNGDGTRDFLSYSEAAFIFVGGGGPNDTSMSLVLTGEDGSATERIHYSLPGAVQTLIAEDLDNDGDLDLSFSSFFGFSGMLLNKTTDQRVGDFNQDGTLDALDIDILCGQLGDPQADDKFNLNGDAVIDLLDIEFLVEKRIGTAVGDANLDGKVDFADFLELSANFGKPDAGWTDGDFDCDGRVGFSDFLALAGNFGFQRNDRLGFV